jgi:Ni/Co efflux regulator RcnB
MARYAYAFLSCSLTKLNKILLYYPFLLSIYMKKLIYFIVAGSLILASCTNSQDSHSEDATEHGHTHDGKSDHTHDAEGKQAPLQQEEFVITDSTQTITDTTTIQKEKDTHTHGDGTTHKDHDHN